MHKRGLVLLLLLFCIPIVYAASIPDCTIANSCTPGYDAVGKVTSQGHFRDISSTYVTPYTLCCAGPLVYNTGVVSFNFVPESGHVSVDSAITTFSGAVKLGFPAKCTVKAACAAGTEEVCIFKVSNVDNSHIVDCNNVGVPVASSGFKEVCCTYVVALTFPVTYNGNGNTGGSAPIDANSPYPAGETVDVLTQGTLLKTGSSFLGWSTTDVDGSLQNYTFNSQFTMPANAVMLTARWTNQLTYLLTYDANGASGTPPLPELHLGGEEVYVVYPYDLVPPPGKPVFIGWNMLSSGFGTMIYVGGSPFNMPTSPLTLYAIWGNGENCMNGVDDDKDGFADCTDQDCKTTMDPAPPQICTGAPLIADSCVLSYTHTAAGVITTVYKPECLGQIPLPPSGDNYYFCSYGKEEDISAGTGICCQVGTYAYQDPIMGTWSCVGSASCGLGSALPCEYDFDYATNSWLNSIYNNPSNADWCVSKYPYYYSPDSTLERSTGCCLMVQHGAVGYFTDNNNVKIFGTS